MWAVWWLDDDDAQAADPRVERQNGMQPWIGDEKSGERQAIVLSRHWRCRAHWKEARRRRIKERREDTGSERRLPHLEELDALWRAAR